MDVHTPLLHRDSILQHYQDSKGRDGTFQKQAHASALRLSGQPVEAVANRVGVGAATIYNWRRGKPPSLVRKAETIAQLFPVTVHRLATSLRPLSRLLAYAALSGHNTYQGMNQIGSNQRSLGFNVRNKRERKFVLRELRKLQSQVRDLRWRIGAPSAASTSKNVALCGEGGQALSRLFHEMGISYGTASDRTQLPLHVTTASAIAKTRDSPHASIVIRDFIDVLELTRGNKRPNRNLVLVSLPVTNTRSTARRFQKQITDIAEQAGRFDTKTARGTVSAKEGKHVVVLQLTAKRRKVA